MLIGEHVEFELQTCFLLCYLAQKNWRQMLDIPLLSDYHFSFSLNISDFLKSTVRAPLTWRLKGQKEFVMVEWPFLWGRVIFIILAVFFSCFLL